MTTVQEEPATDLAKEKREAFYEEMVLRYRERRRAQHKLGGFLYDNGFKTVHSRREWLLGRRFTYPLHRAAAAGDAEVVRLLLRAGADPEQVDYRGRTALQLAPQGGRTKSGSAVVAVFAAELPLQARTPVVGISKIRHWKEICGERPLSLIPSDDAPGHWELFFRHVMADRPGSQKVAQRIGLPRRSWPSPP